MHSISRGLDWPLIKQRACTEEICLACTLHCTTYNMKKLNKLEANNTVVILSLLSTVLLELLHK